MEQLLGLIVRPVQNVANSARQIIHDPHETGLQVAHITQWVTHFRGGFRKGVNFNRLLARMYPKTGESAELSVPQIDYLSDIERDLLLLNSVATHQIAAGFEDWYCTSPHFMQLGRDVLHPDCDLPEALMVLYDEIGNKVDVNVNNIVPFVAANLVSCQESVRTCIERFEERFSSHSADGVRGWATKRSQSFPDLEKPRTFTPIPEACLKNVDLDVSELQDSQKLLLAVVMTKNAAEIIYESADVTSQAIRIDESGSIRVTKESDFSDPESDVDWMRLMALVLRENLRLASTFSIIELSLVLMEVIAVESDGMSEMLGRGQGCALWCHLSTDRERIATSLTLLAKLIRLSGIIRTAARSFAVREPPMEPPVFGLNLQEARKEPPAPVYEYRHLKFALAYIDEMKEKEEQTAALAAATDGAFATDGALQRVSNMLENIMRTEIARVQREYSPKSRKRDVERVSGSFWLDRIAKGKLLTAERARTLTAHKKRKHVPQEFQSKRETAFYFPLYDRTVVFPNEEDVTNVRYNRLQVGNDGDLTSVVSVLVAAIMWAGAQKMDIVEAAIKADAKGTQDLIQFADGGLSTQIRTMFAKKAEGDLKVSDLATTVHSEMEGPMDKEWVIREVLSLAVLHGIVCTINSERMGGYIEVVDRVRNGNAKRLLLIDADTYVSMSGVQVRQVTEQGRRVSEFLVIDDSLKQKYDVALVGNDGDLSTAIHPRRKKKKVLVLAHIKAAKTRDRTVVSQFIGTLEAVSVQ